MVLDILETLSEIAEDEIICLEDFPSLSVAQIRAGGAELPTHSSMSGVRYIVNTAGSRTIPVTVFCFESYFYLFHEDDDKEIGQTIPYVKRKYGVAERILFVCPATGGMVSKLYLKNRSFLSRNACRTPYRSQVASVSHWKRHSEIVDELRGAGGRKPARGKRRDKLIARLKTLPRRHWRQEDHWLIDLYELEKLAAPDRKHERERAKRQRETSVTARAIDRCAYGEGYVSPSVAAAAVERLGAKSPPAFPERNWPGLAMPRGALEDHETLDIRVLLRRGLICPGQIRAWAMRWDRPDPDGLAYLAADLRSETLPHLRIVRTSPSGTTSQVIGLMEPASSGRGCRWMFIDPATFRPCEVLALRGGRFASRQSQHLVHASQIRGKGRGRRATGRPAVDRRG